MLCDSARLTPTCQILNHSLIIPISDYTEISKGIVLKPPLHSAVQDPSADGQESGFSPGSEQTGVKVHISGASSRGSGTFPC